MDDQQEVRGVCQENWKGCIPIKLSLAPTSLSCSTMPLPRHSMVSRMTFLHVALRPAILRFYKFAPKLVYSFQPQNVEEEEDDDDDDVEQEMDHHKTKNSKTNDKTKEEVEEEEEEDPVCWFEDEESGTPLRWQLFVGVLFDLLQNSHGRNNHTNNKLPWKIRIHFTSYPQTQLLQLTTSTTTKVQDMIQRFYSNSLKQALFLQYGSSKVAMNMSKHNQLQIWDSIVRSQYDSYQQINQELQCFIPINETESTQTQKIQNVPIRIMMDGKPYVQKPCPPYITTLPASNTDNHDTSNTKKLHKRTIGQFLAQYYPKIFSSTEKTSLCIWMIQGIQQLPLSYPIVDVWQCLCHPDHFLYIILITNTTKP